MEICLRSSGVDILDLRQVGCEPYRIGAAKAFTMETPRDGEFRLGVPLRGFAWRTGLLKRLCLVNQIVSGNVFVRVDVNPDRLRSDRWAVFHFSQLVIRTEVHLPRRTDRAQTCGRGLGDRQKQSEPCEP